MSCPFRKYFLTESFSQFASIFVILAVSMGILPSWKHSMRQSVSLNLNFTLNGAGSDCCSRIPLFNVSHFLLTYLRLFLLIPLEVLLQDLLIPCFTFFLLRNAFDYPDLILFQGLSQHLLQVTTAPKMLLQILGLESGLTDQLYRFSGQVVKNREYRVIFFLILCGYFGEGPLAETVVTDCGQPEVSSMGLIWIATKLARKVRLEVLERTIGIGRRWVVCERTVSLSWLQGKFINSWLAMHPLSYNKDSNLNRIECLSPIN